MYKPGYSRNSSPPPILEDQAPQNGFLDLQVLRDGEPLPIILRVGIGSAAEEERL